MNNIQINSKVIEGYKRQIKQLQKENEELNKIIGWIKAFAERNINDSSGSYCDNMEEIRRKLKLK